GHAANGAGALWPHSLQRLVQVIACTPDFHTGTPTPFTSTNLGGGGPAIRQSPQDIHVHQTVLAPRRHMKVIQQPLPHPVLHLFPALRLWQNESKVVALFAI